MVEYQLVSMGAIIRDYREPRYKNEEHKRLCDIADSLYNINIPVEEWGDNPEFNYKQLYKQYGEEFWTLVIKDMSAIDSQLYRQGQIEELIEEYNERLGE